MYLQFARIVTPMNNNYIDNHTITAVVGNLFDIILFWDYTYPANCFSYTGSWHAL